jgi:hypothetical protein
MSVNIKLSLFSIEKLTLCSFLAHARVITMMCCPSYSSSVGRARFVTTGAIYLKFCTYVPLCDLTSQTKFRSDSWLGHQGVKTKTKSTMINSSTNGWIISKFLS